MTFLAFILIAVILVVAYLIMPVPMAAQQSDVPPGESDLTFPTNSNSKLIPILYGTAWLRGNLICLGYVGKEAITACP